jgi:transposase-like protein
MMYVRFPLSLRNVEDLLHERGIDIRHETVRFWWNRFGPAFAAAILRCRDKGNRQRRQTGNWPLAQQPGRESTPIAFSWFVSKPREGPFRRRERAMQRFPSMRTLQKFVAVHASTHHHSNQERHLYSRSNFKLNRAAALSEWRGICAS